MFDARQIMKGGQAQLRNAFRLGELATVKLDGPRAAVPRLIWPRCMIAEATAMDANVPAGNSRGLFHPGLIAAGSTLLIATAVSDFLYWQTLLFQWNNVSEWLLAAGLTLATLAGIAFVIDLLLGRVGPIFWMRFVALAAAASMSIINAFIHSRDAYTAVVPEGIVLSSVVAIILLVVGLCGGWSLGYRRTLPATPYWDIRS